MQMWPLRSTRITTPGDLLTLPDREKCGGDRQIDPPRLLPVLLLPDICRQCGKEAVKMTVYRCVSVGMMDVDRLPESKGAHLHPGHITVRSRVHGQVLAMLRPNIQPHMVMVGPQLAKFGGQAHGDGKRVPEIMLWIVRGG